MKADIQSTLGITAVVTGLLAFVGIGAANALYGPSLPALSDRYALDGASAGLVLAAHGTGAFVAVAACLMPGLEARMRFRPAFALMMIGLGALLIAGDLAWPFLLIGAFSIGIGFGLLTVGFNGLFARSFGNSSASMVNLLNAVYGIGAIFAPIVFVYSGGSPSFAFGALAILAFFVVPMALVVDDRSDHVAAAGASATTSRAGAKRSIMPMAFMFFAVGAEAAIIGWGPTILIARGSDALEAATAVSWFFVVFLVARLVAVLVASFLTYRTLALSALLALVCCCALAATAQNATTWFAAMGIVGVVFPNAFGWLSRLLEDAPGGDARIVVSALAGNALIPPLLGVSTTVIGEAALFAAIAAVLAITGAVGLAVRR
ncbi:MAG: MFS transporter [Pseudomonadota bacterium]